MKPNGRSLGRPGGWQHADLPEATDAADWFGGRLPDTWFQGSTSIEADREEIVVVGTLPAEQDGSPAALEGRIARFRETTRGERMQIAAEAEKRYGRKVAWGIRTESETILFTHLAVPVMTRLRQPERRVLDTLVDAGVARSRADAVAWAVKLVGEHTQEWLDELRGAMETVDELRKKGPSV